MSAPETPPTVAEQLRRGERRRSQWGRRLLIAYGFLLATVAVAALVIGMLSLRNEERKQTKCAQASAFATVYAQPSAGAEAGFSQRTGKLAIQMLSQCASLP